MKYITTFFLLFPFTSISQHLDSLLLQSKVLNRQIEVVTIDYSEGKSKTIYYFTDGKKMIENGTIRTIDSLSKHQQIPKASYIFVSTIDPTTQEDHRNEYFFCNEDYVLFFEQELIPKIESQYASIPQRYLIGISFGGLNTAFFAAKSSAFQGFGLLSPITYPCESIHTSLTFSKFQDYKVYISTGKADAEYYVNTLYPIFTTKTSSIKLVKTTGGHDFENWNQQLKAVIQFMDRKN